MDKFANSPERLFYEFNVCFNTIIVVEMSPCSGACENERGVVWRRSTGKGNANELSTAQPCTAKSADERKSNRVNF